MFCSYDDRHRPVLGRIVIANYITVTTDSKNPIHRDIGQNVLFYYIKPGGPMLPSEETLLMTARIL